MQGQEFNEQKIEKIEEKPFENRTLEQNVQDNNVIYDEEYDKNDNISNVIIEDIATHTATEQKPKSKFSMRPTLGYFRNVIIPVICYSGVCGILVGVIVGLYTKFANLLTEWSKEIYTLVHNNPIWSPLLLAGLVVIAMLCYLLLKITPECKGSGVLPMFYLELITGLRRGELLALLWTDLNIKEKCLTVSKSVSRGKGELRVTEPKTSNSIRTVYIDDEAVRLLVENRKRHPFSPYLFPSPVTGGMYGPDCVARIHKKLLAKAGIEEHVRFHDLRRTFTTLALQNGVDPKTVSRMLGHYSAEFTLDVYTNVTKDMQREAAQKIGGFVAAVV